jgi:hypothetical protein
MAKRVNMVNIKWGEGTRNTEQMAGKYETSTRKRGTGTCGASPPFAHAAADLNELDEKIAIGAAGIFAAAGDI